jgi:hypothetical protein
MRWFRVEWGQNTVASPKRIVTMGETRAATRPAPETGATDTDAGALPTGTARRDEGDPIADALQTLFRSTEAEPLPDHLKALLDRLAAEEEAAQ